MISTEVGCAAQHLRATIHPTKQHNTSEKRPTHLVLVPDVRAPVKKRLGGSGVTIPGGPQQCGVPGLRVKQTRERRARGAKPEMDPDGMAFVTRSNERGSQR